MISSGRYPYMLSAPAFQDSITPSRVFRKIASCDDSTIAARSPVSACLASSVFDMGRSFPRRSGLVPPGAYVWLTSRFTGAGGPLNAVWRSGWTTRARDWEGQGVLVAAPARPAVSVDDGLGVRMGEGLGEGLGVRIPNSCSTRWRVTVRAPVFGDCSMRS